jgi:hypothetical protein
MIHTPKTLRRTARRLDRRNRAQQQRRLTAARILEVMRDGASLHRCNHQHRTVWVLSNGEFVTVEAATEVMRNPHVVGVGDSLFGPELSQTFRYSE